MKRTTFGRPSLSRAGALVTAAAVTLSVAGCGVLDDGSKAASYQDNTVSTSQVQDAVRDIDAAAPTSGVTGQRVAILLALRPAVTDLAAKYGVGISTGDVENLFYQQGFPRSKTPSASAVQAIQTQNLLSNLGDSPKGSPALTKLINGANIDLNPRYGTWKKGGQIGPASNDWLKTDPKTQQQQP